jgi:uncharacterized protein (DUF1778 family)
MKRATAKLSKPAARETLHLRIAALEVGLIDRAAKSSGKTRTAFILFCGAARVIARRWSR